MNRELGFIGNFATSFSYGHGKVSTEKVKNERKIALLRLFVYFVQPRADTADFWADRG